MDKVEILQCEHRRCLNYPLAQPFFLSSLLSLSPLILPRLSKFFTSPFPHNTTTNPTPFSTRFFQTTTPKKPANCCRHPSIFCNLSFQHQFSCSTTSIVSRQTGGGSLSTGGLLGKKDKRDTSTCFKAFFPLTKCGQSMFSLVPGLIP